MNKENTVKKERKITWFPKFTTKNLAVLGILTAVSYLLYMFAKFPLPFMFPAFLDMQFSDLPALLGSFSLGPFGGAVIIIIKCLLKMPFSSTACVGELADIIVGLANVIPAGIFYQFYKSKKGAILALLIGAVSATAVSLVANRFLLVPFFVENFGFGAVIGMVKSIYPNANEANFYAYYLPVGVLPFNILRCIVCGVLTYFTYKPLSKALHWEETSKKAKGNSGEGVTVQPTDDQTEGNKQIFTSMEYISDSAKRTEEIAFEFAKQLKSGDVVILDGDLGAGKTVFVKGLAKYFGYTGVTSPTYAYLNVYGDYIYHYDCYRLSSGEDAERLGLTDYFNGENICVIEWAENIADALPDGVKRVTIEKIDQTQRKIIL